MWPSETRAPRSAGFVIMNWNRSREGTYTDPRNHDSSALSSNDFSSRFRPDVACSC